MNDDIDYLGIEQIDICLKKVGRIPSIDDLDTFCCTDGSSLGYPAGLMP